MLTERLVRKFIPEGETGENADVRRRCGALSGGVGIGLNVLLAAGKFIAGLLAGSIAMTGDALNNLTDAASSVVTLVGFRMAGKKADRGHPFGHGRIEYVSGFFVSVIILLVAWELGKTSVGAILRPEPVDVSWVSAGVLGVSILVKLWLWWFNRKLSRRLHSAALGATAADSLSDCVATGAVLAGSLLCRWTGLKLDGWLGLAVAVFIARTGFVAAWETLDPLLGKAPDPELVEHIREIVLKSDAITGLHDLEIHDYGPGHTFATIHAEVSAQAGIVEAHNAVDRVERELLERCQVQAVIHVDPVGSGGEEAGETAPKEG